jgi:hypothetical protein
MTVQNCLPQFTQLYSHHDTWTARGVAALGVDMATPLMINHSANGISNAAIGK